jgi:exodeoxyribonuclease VII large subunit
VDVLKRGVLKRDGERLLREPMLRLDTARGRLAQALRASLDEAAARVKEARAGHRAHHPARVLERRMEVLETLHRRLERAGAEAIEQRGRQLVRLRGMLRALGPESAFQRGFSITLSEDGRVLRSAGGLKAGDLLRTKFADGESVSRVVGPDGTAPR